MIKRDVTHCVLCGAASLVIFILWLTYSVGDVQPQTNQLSYTASVSPFTSDQNFISILVPVWKIITLLKLPGKDKSHDLAACTVTEISPLLAQQLAHTFYDPNSTETAFRCLLETFCSHSALGGLTVKHNRNIHTDNDTDISMTFCYLPNFSWPILNSRTCPGCQISPKKCGNSDHTADKIRHTCSMGQTSEYAGGQRYR